MIAKPVADYIENTDQLDNTLEQGGQGQAEWVMKVEEEVETNYPVAEAEEDTDTAAAELAAEKFDSAAAEDYIADDNSNWEAFGNIPNSENTDSLELVAAAAEVAGPEVAKDSDLWALTAADGEQKLAEVEEEMACTTPF